MKKALLVAAVAVLSLTVSGMASTLSFSQGAEFVTWSTSSNPMVVGSSTQITWYVDDLGYGFRHESGQFMLMMFGSSYSTSAEVNEIVINKYLSKSVSVGLGFGQGMVNINPFGPYVAPTVSIRGDVTILAGKGEKINASLDFGIAQRWVNSTDFPSSEGNLNHTAVTLAVTLGL